MLELREAVFEDLETLYDWANDPETRKNSFNAVPIAPETHRAWVHEKLSSPNVLLLIGVDLGKPVGVIRFEQGGDTALLHFTVAPESRGRGYGTAVLTRGVSYVFKTEFASRIRGVVKYPNSASLRCFRNAGFKHIEDSEVNGLRCAVFEIEASDLASAGKE